MSLHSGADDPLSFPPRGWPRQELLLLLLLALVRPGPSSGRRWAPGTADDHRWLRRRRQGAGSSGPSPASAARGGSCIFKEDPTLPDLNVYQRDDDPFSSSTQIDHIVKSTAGSALSRSPRLTALGLVHTAAARSLPRIRTAAMPRAPVEWGCAAAAALILLRLRSGPSAAASSSDGAGRLRPGEALSRAVTFWRMVGPVVAQYKIAQVWLNVRNAPLDVRTDTWEGLHARHAPRSLDAILQLRGLYVKIGQVLSSRADFIPRQYVDAFQTLQDAVPPWPKERVERLMADSLRSDQGLEIGDVFESFGDVLGSASIGQVHRAVLRPDVDVAGYSGGRTVAVKVMHLDAESRFFNDFKVFRWLCRIALPGWEPILRELQQQMMTEFNYLNEAASLATIRANMARSPYAKKIRVPEPVMGLCSKNLLVMEMLEGKKLAVAIEDRLAGILDGNKDLARKVLKAKQQAMFEGKATASDGSRSKASSLYRELNDMVGAEGKSSMGALRRAITALRLVSLTKRARKTLSLLLDVHGHQIFLDGRFNGDPHPGNILELDCGRLGLIDYGQCRSLDDHDRLALSRIVAELGKGDDAADTSVAEAMWDFGFRSKYRKDDVVAKMAALYFDSDAAGRALGYLTPQMYLQYLIAQDPMVNVPDAAVFVARTSFLFRGLGALLQQQLHTARHWSKHAQAALDLNS